MSTATQTTHLFAAAAMLPVLVYLCSVSAHVLHAQPSPNAPLGTSSIWAGSPPSANGRSLNADDNKSTMTPRKAASGAPIYELKHGLGVFTIASGTGCYEGAKGQAQARFGVLTADVDLFVPSVLDMLDDDTGATPQDTVFEKVNEDDDVQRRLDFPTNRTDSHQCDIFHRGKKSFNQISVSMERRSSPVNDRGAVQDTSSSYHHHGTFKAKEDWYDGMTGEYSLSCIHHECTMSLTFGIGGSENCENGSCGTSGSMSAFAKGEKGTTSLKLQGTTELAYQGADTSMLVCVENCEDDAGGPAVNTDAEYVETISVRSFDNNIVQVHSSHGTKAPKAAKGAGGTKAPKAAKGAGGTKAPKGESHSFVLIEVIFYSTSNHICSHFVNFYFEISVIMKPASLPKIAKPHLWLIWFNVLLMQIVVPTRCANRRLTLANTTVAPSRSWATPVLIHQIIPCVLPEILTHLFCLIRPRADMSFKYHQLDSRKWSLPLLN